MPDVLRRYLAKVSHPFCDRAEGDAYMTSACSSAVTCRARKHVTMSHNTCAAAAAAAVQHLRISQPKNIFHHILWRNVSSISSDSSSSSNSTFTASSFISPSFFIEMRATANISLHMPSVRRWRQDFRKSFSKKTQMPLKIRARRRFSGSYVKC